MTEKSWFDDRKEHDIFLYPRALTGSRAHTTCYSMENGAFPERGSMTRHETDYSPPVSAEVKFDWSYTGSPPYVSMKLTEKFYPYV
jgi:hypothetical protein